MLVFKCKLFLNIFNQYFFCVCFQQINMPHWKNTENLHFHFTLLLLYGRIRRENIRQCDLFQKLAIFIQSKNKQQCATHYQKKKIVKTSCILKQVTAILKKFYQQFYTERKLSSNHLFKQLNIFITEKIQEIERAKYSVQQLQSEMVANIRAIGFPNIEHQSELVSTSQQTIAQQLPNKGIQVNGVKQEQEDDLLLICHTNRIESVQDIVGNALNREEILQQRISSIQMSPQLGDNILPESSLERVYHQDSDNALMEKQQPHI